MHNMVNISQLTADGAMNIKSTAAFDAEHRSEF